MTDEQKTPAEAKTTKTRKTRTPRKKKEEVEVVTDEKAVEEIVEKVNDETKEAFEALKAEHEALKAQLELEQRKQALKDGLIGSAEEKVDSELERERVENRRQATVPTEPSTEDAFKRNGTSVGGPFARRRTAPVSDKAKSYELGADKERDSRRGVHRIWDDKPVNNVGKGTHK